MIPLIYCLYGNICQLSMHESNTFLFLKYSQKEHSYQWGEPPQNLPFLLGHVDPSNTQMLGLIPLTTPNSNSISSCIFAQV